MKYVWEKEYKDSFYKVFLKVLDGKTYRVEIQMNSGKVSVNIIEVNVNTKNQFGMLKNRIFPQNINHKSVKQRSEIKIKMYIVKKLIESSVDIEALKSEISSILK